MNKNQFEEFENEYSNVNPKELVYSIWNQPKLTLMYILDKCPEKYVFLFLVLGGIVRTIGKASERGMGDNMSTISVLLYAFILGGLLGWISYYIYSWAMSFTGNWLDGNAIPSKFRTILAWALVPSIASLILLIPEFIFFGDDLFRSVQQDQSMISSIGWMVFGFIELGLGIWTAVILVIGIKLIQGFGTGKAILNMILPGLLIILPILIIYFLVS